MLRHNDCVAAKSSRQPQSQIMSERSPPKSTRRFASEPLAVAANCRIFGSEVGVVRRKSGLTIEAFDAAGERLLQGGEVCHHSTSYLERISLHGLQSRLARYLFSPSYFASRPTPHSRFKSPCEDRPSRVQGLLTRRTVPTRCTLLPQHRAPMTSWSHYMVP